MAELDSESILDPAHSDDTGVTNAGVAGLPGPEPKPGEAAKSAGTEPKVSEDGNVLEHGGKKYITYQALESERRQRQELANTLAALDPVMPEFEEFLKVRNQRRESTQRQVASAGPKDDPEYLNEVAIALGFFDEQNQPDQRRAQAHLNISRRESKRMVEDAIKPIAEGNARDRSAVNRERARTATFSDGRPVADERYMDAAFNALPPEYLADPNIANITQVIAAGLEYLDHRKNGTLPTRQGRTGSREPMFVEHGSGRFDAGGDEGLSELDLAAARARGKSPEQWAKLSKQINKSGPSNRGSAILEDV